MSRKHFRAVKALAAEHGLWVDVGGAHLKLRNSRGGLVAVASVSVSDHRSMANLRSTLRRATKVSSEDGCTT